MDASPLPSQGQENESPHHIYTPPTRDILTWEMANHGHEEGTTRNTPCNRIKDGRGAWMNTIHENQVETNETCARVYATHLVMRRTRSTRTSSDVQPELDRRICASLVAWYHRHPSIRPSMQCQPFHHKEQELDARTCAIGRLVSSTFTL